MTDPEQSEQVEPEEQAENMTPEVDADVNIAGMQTQLEALTEALESSKENVLRAQADALNARRRAEQDVEKAHKFGQEKLVVALLPVMDNLERALASIDTTDAVFTSVVEGIELTLKSFEDTLKGCKVEQLSPEGEPFDPQLHQAMTMIDNPDVEANTVIDVFQKGYTLHGRLIRPAMVVVSK